MNVNPMCTFVGICLLAFVFTMPTQAQTTSPACGVSTDVLNGYDSDTEFLDSSLSAGNNPFATSNIITCIIRPNPATGGANEIACFSASPLITNCIFGKTSPDKMNRYDCAPLVTYCGVQCAYTCTDEIDFDFSFPLTSTTPDDYHDGDDEGTEADQPTVNAIASEVIMEHGKYSQTYLSDWANLPTGKKMIQANLQKEIGTALGLKENDFNLKTGKGFKSVIGENIKTSKVWKPGNNNEVYLKNLAYKVKWNTTPYHGVLFYYYGYKRVVIENLAIIQENSDYRTYNAVIVRGCDEVVVRNTYFAGTAGHAHIRIEGCKRVLVENTEIAGIDYFGTGKFRNGAGIHVLNGNSATPMTPVLEWLTIQNCYIHDLNDGYGTWKNQDGILLESPADGILFNCYFENWDRTFGDGAIDAGHRNLDVNYAKNHFFRIERNIIKDCSYTKSPGTAANNILFWTNNLYLNAMHIDYHSNSAQYFVNNSFIFEPLSSPWIYELDAFGGPTYIQNCLIYKPLGQFNVFVNQNASPPSDKWKGIHSDCNVLRMGLYPHDRWIAGNTEINTLEDWQNAGNDLHSIMDVREVLGKNLLSDSKSGNSGEFTDWTGNTPDGWTTFGVDAKNYVALDSGKCKIVCNGGGVGIKQPILTVGKTYKYFINITNIKSGSLRLGTGEALATFSVMSNRTGYLTAYEKDFVIKRNTSPADISFDNVWIKELEGCSAMDDYFAAQGGESGYYTLEPDSPAAHAGCTDYLSPPDSRMKVICDFKGKSRGIRPSAGAFED